MLLGTAVLFASEAREGAAQAGSRAPALWLFAQAGDAEACPPEGCQEQPQPGAEPSGAEQQEEIEDAQEDAEVEQQEEIEDAREDAEVEQQEPAVEGQPGQPASGQQQQLEGIQQPQQPAIVEPGQPQQPAIAEPVQPQQPAIVEPGQPQQPAAVEPGQPQQPAIAEPGQPQQPAIVEPDQPQQPAAVEEGQPQQPATVEEGQPQQPAIVEPGQPQQPATVEPVQPQQPRREQEDVLQQLRQQFESGPQQQRQEGENRRREPSGGGGREAEPIPVPVPEQARDTTVEEQLERQGDREEAENVRDMREELIRQLLQAIVPPQAQPPAGPQRFDRRGDGERFGAARPGGQPPRGFDGRGRNGFYARDEAQGDVVDQRAGRVIFELGGGQLYVRPVVPDEGGRLLYGARDVDVQQLPGGRTRSVVHARDGGQIITVRNRYGDILRRIKVLPGGREIVLIDNRPDFDDSRRGPPILRNVPPPRVAIPQRRYIMELGLASRADIRWALLAPPVAPLPRQFTLNEVLRNQQVRAYSPRIDLDTITFDFGSATIGTDQMPALYELGYEMEQVIAENPDEIYLIEGHTDAVGSDYDNLFLSDRRAEAVAVALSQNFHIPPENLITEGYGEQYLKIPTDGPERRNRRASVRRLTDLLYHAGSQ